MPNRLKRKGNLRQGALDSTGMADSSTSMSPAKALEEVRRAIRLEASLRSRTEGLTWIIWGLVSAATFLTFEAVTSLYYGDTPFTQGASLEEQHAPWWAGGLWMPWLVLGILTTYALWRSAALSSPDVADHHPRHFLVFIGWIAAVAAGWLVAVLALPNANVATFPVMGIGTAWILLGALNLYRGTRLGRVVATLVGATIFVAGLTMAATMSPHASVDRSGAIVGHVGALVTGLIPFLGGLWQTLRG